MHKDITGTGEDTVYRKTKVQPGLNGLHEKLSILYLSVLVWSLSLKVKIYHSCQTAQTH